MRYEATAVGERVAVLKEAWHLNAVPESPVRRFRPWFLPGSKGALILCLVALLGRPLLLSSQTLHYVKSPDVGNGERVYKGGCIACHGSKGKGASMASTVFKRPDTFPDFTDCAGTTPEPNGNWKAAIVPTPRVIAPIARVRHFGGLGSGMGASSQTALGEGVSSRARVEPVSLVFALAEEEPSTGKDAGLASNNELTDEGDVDWDDISAVSTVGSWGLEE